jgi:Phage integrase, N-terminal SAM-like domain
MAASATKHTRSAYLHAVKKFLAWCEQRDIELQQITPKDVGQYFSGEDIDLEVTAHYGASFHQIKLSCRPPPCSPTGDSLAQTFCFVNENPPVINGSCIPI